jgi:hypothetical protein
MNLDTAVIYELRDRLNKAEARIRELEQALEKIRDYPHGVENCCVMSQIAGAAIEERDKALAACPASELFN